MYIHSTSVRGELFARPRAVRALGGAPGSFGFSESLGLNTMTEFETARTQYDSGVRKFGKFGKIRKDR